jgi:hypothetical protein
LADHFPPPCDIRHHNRRQTHRSCSLQQLESSGGRKAALGDEDLEPLWNILDRSHETGFVLKISNLPALSG